jgi:hypothetical protein
LVCRDVLNAEGDRRFFDGQQSRGAFCVAAVDAISQRYASSGGALENASNQGMVHDGRAVEAP